MGQKIHYPFIQRRARVYLCEKKSVMVPSSPFKIRNNDNDHKDDNAAGGKNLFFIDFCVMLFHRCV
jgi:hypothetical protein